MTPHKFNCCGRSQKVSGSLTSGKIKKKLKAARRSIKSKTEPELSHAENCAQYEERIDNSMISTEKFFMEQVESTAAEDEWVTTLETNGAFIN